MLPEKDKMVTRLGEAIMTAQLWLGMKDGMKTKEHDCSYKTLFITTVDC